MLVDPAVGRPTGSVLRRRPSRPDGDPGAGTARDVDRVDAVVVEELARPEAAAAGLADHVRGAVAAEHVEVVGDRGQRDRARHRARAVARTRRARGRRSGGRRRPAVRRARRRRSPDWSRAATLPSRQYPGSRGRSPRLVDVAQHGRIDRDLHRPQLRDHRRAARGLRAPRAARSAGGRRRSSRRARARAGRWSRRRRRRPGRPPPRSASRRSGRRETAGRTPRRRRRRRPRRRAR